MRMNFQKKALALVLAVLMILSSVSALAFAAPNGSKLAQSNQEAIENVLTVDTTVETVTGSFPDDPANKHGDKYYKNVLYSPQAENHVGWHDAYNDFGYKGKAEVCYSPSSVIMYEGSDGVKPTVPVMIRFSSDTKTNAYYMFAKELKLRNNTANNFDVMQTWNRKIKQGDNAGKYNFAESIEKIPGDSNTGYPFDFANGAQEFPKSESAKAYANVLTLKKTYTNDVYTDVLYPEFQFKHSSKGFAPWSDVQPLTNNHPVYVVNYAPLKTALEEAQVIVKQVENNKDLYTNASVKELVKLTNALLAAKPDKILASQMSNGNITDVNAAVNAYKDAASAAINEWNKWCNDNKSEGGLVKATVELVNVTEQTFAVDFDGKASYNLNANEPQRDEANVTYLGYSKDVKNTNKLVNIALESYSQITDSTTINTEYGNIKINKQGNISYDITDLANFTTPITFYVLANIQVNNLNTGSGFKWKKVTILPANSIYIEDDNESVFTYTGKWESATSAENSAVAGAEDLEKFGNIHGYDSAYANSDMYSAGNAMKTVVKPGTNATVKFNFTGTGFDVISMASNKSGVFLVEVKDTKGKRVKAAMVDTYTYSEFTENGWVENAAGATALYQIPAIKIEGLSYGTYEVTITPRLSNNNPENTCEFILDGVRVYNPMQDQKPYEKDNEANAKYTEVNTVLVPAEKLSKVNQNGIVFISNGTVTNAAELKKINEISANHELYLSKGQTIAFTVEGNPASVQVGAKKVGAISGTPKMNDITINTSTEMYYELSENNGVYTVTNNGDGILSLTNIKTTSKTTAAAVSFKVNEATPRLALATMNAPKADLSVNALAPVVDGKTVTIKATTSLDVAVLNVTDANGKAIDAKITSTVNGNVKEWTVEIVEANAGTYTYVISGEYDCGFTNDSASAVVTATIEEAAAPQLTFGQKVVNFFKKIFGIKF